MSANPGIASGTYKWIYILDYWKYGLGCIGNQVGFGIDNILVPDPERTRNQQPGQNYQPEAGQQDLNKSFHLNQIYKKIVMIAKINRCSLQSDRPENGATLFE